jgi:predicted acetyltransferase
VEAAELAVLALVEPGELEDGELRLALESFGRHPFHRVPCYSFRMVHAETGYELGGIRLRVGSTPHVELYAGHIGYSVHREHRGHHYAARSVRLLLPLARRAGLNPVWITCDPDNAASKRSIELAGGVYVETVDVPPNCAIFQTGHPHKCRYSL